MNFKSTDLFPYPHIVNNEMRDGSIIAWPDSCRSCMKKACGAASTENLATCAHGYDFIRVDKNTVVGGIIVKEATSISAAKRKKIRREKDRIVSRERLTKAITAMRGFRNTFEEEVEKQKKEIVEKYIENEQFKSEFLSSLKHDIQKGLSFVHDYKQINMQISQNINVIVESKYSGENITDKIEKATDNEKAIYFASKMLDEKLNVAKFLMHPEWLDKRDDCVYFRPHGLVLKYYRIYSPLFERKRLKYKIIGTSHLEIYANPQAVAVIPHTLIDNAAKYSPIGGSVEIYINDLDDSVEMSVSNFGPKIGADEMSKIFEPFYRGKAARDVENEGAGYGLYVSQMIAIQHLGTKIYVEQEKKETPQKGYWTTFTLKIPFKAIILF